MEQLPGRVHDTPCRYTHDEATGQYVIDMENRLYRLKLDGLMPGGDPADVLFEPFSGDPVMLRVYLVSPFEMDRDPMKLVGYQVRSP